MWGDHSLFLLLGHASPFDGNPGTQIAQQGLQSSRIIHGFQQNIVCKFLSFQTNRSGSLPSQA